VCELVHTCASGFAAAWTGRSRNLVADPGRNCLERTIILAECRPARFSGGAMEPSPALPIALLGRGAFRKNRADQAPLLAGLSLIPFILVGAYTVAVAVTEIRNWHRNGRRRLMSNAEHIYNIANDHAQTVQVCIDRLHKLGANEQLKRLTARLQKLAVRAAPGDDDKDTKAARRQRGGIKGTNSRYVDA
jgi:hypothetical protein